MLKVMLKDISKIFYDQSAEVTKTSRDLNLVSQEHCENEIAWVYGIT